MKRALLLVLSACATLADGAPGLDNPPGAHAGPFRVLAIGEIGQGRVAPKAIDDGATFMRDPSVLDSDGDPATLDVEGYFAASEEDAGVDAPPVRIMRSLAVDGRSFDRTPVAVLERSHAWEGESLGAPSVVLGDSDQRLLFYAADGGIGRAVASGPGATFESGDAPVLSRAALDWPTAELRSPGAVRLFDGSYRLYFETEQNGVAVIGVATSSDGANFVDAGPVLRATGRTADLDGAYVGSPQPVITISAEDREILFLYYAARNDAGKQAITMAARFLAEPGEQLDRSAASSYSPSGSLEPREPCVVRFEAFSLLFTTQRSAKNTPDPVITVGVSPGNIELPPPEPL